MLEEQGQHVHQQVHLVHALAAVPELLESVDVAAALVKLMTLFVLERIVEAGVDELRRQLKVILCHVERKDYITDYRS